MQSLIKWPGGKTSEYEIIKQFIPKFSRYVEPFFGGGAVFFCTSPKKSVINDISKNLMDFYKYIKEEDIAFKSSMYEIYDEWETLKREARTKTEKLSDLFTDFRDEESKSAEINEEIILSCRQIVMALAEKSNGSINEELLYFQLRRMVKDKIYRTRKNEIKNNYCLSVQDLKDNILTGFTSGFFMYFRDIFNSIESGKIVDISNEMKIAVFYFIREFCYGSMFRYNKNGEFNIPYGGIAYNNKDFKKKVDTLFSDETRAYFKETEIHNCDFEEIFDMAREGDFFFLDPPYDTDFSDYENRCFSEKDQRRLEKRLHNFKAKFLLIIKNTPLISELYANNGYNVYAFDNKYSYCVKGRNDRNAVHLIITNYDQDKNF